MGDSKQGKNYGSVPSRVGLYVTLVLVSIFLIVGIFYFLSSSSAEDKSKDTSQELDKIVSGSFCSFDSDCVNGYGDDFYCSEGSCYKRVSSGGSDGLSSGVSNTSEISNDTGKSSSKGFFDNFLSGFAISSDAGKAIYYDDGWVGIGTLIPQRSLHVIGEIVTSGADARIALGRSDGNYDPSSTRTWNIDNYQNTFRIFSQPDLNTIGDVGGLYITENGNVGIGTSTPHGQALLQVGKKDSLTDSIGIRLSGTADKEGGEIRIDNGGNYDSTFDFYVIDTYEGKLRIFAQPDENSYGTGFLTVTPDRKFGFGGVSDPKTTLDVNGIIKTVPVSSAICDSNSEGGIYYDSDDDTFYGCTGSGWEALN